MRLKSIYRSGMTVLILLFGNFLMPFNILSQANGNQVVGTITAYYAQSALKCTLKCTTYPNCGTFEQNYNQGEFIGDTDSYLSTLSSLDKNYYKFEYTCGDMSGLGKILKSKVVAKCYNKSLLPVKVVGEEMRFVDDKGHKARIFVANTKSYKIWNEADENVASTLNGNYMLSIEWYYDGRTELIEAPLKTSNNCIDFYRKVLDSKRLVGILDEKFCPRNDHWNYEKSAFGTNGELLTNLDYFEQAPIEELGNINTIAYIADMDALYFNGVLYYHKK